MGARNRPDLNLDLNSGYDPKTISDFFSDLSLINSKSERLAKLEDFISLLKNEMGKIECFSRELPFTMLLLNDAIERLSEEKMVYVEKEVRPVAEQFLPMKGVVVYEDDEERAELSICNKSRMSSSAQLPTTQNLIRNLESGQRSKFGCGGGAFLPFGREPVSVGLPSYMKEMNKDLAVSGLSMAAPAVRKGFALYSDSKGKASIDGVVAPSSPVAPAQPRLLKRGGSAVGNGGEDSGTRKRRRCWTAELHRQFLDALRKLGGPHVATPKQISEVMNIEGLTTDEIKSHLQKYRLHIRKVSDPSFPTSTQTYSWCHRDRYKGQSGSPDGPLYLSGSSKAGSMNRGNNMVDDEDDDNSDVI